MPKKVIVTLLGALVLAIGGAAVVVRLGLLSPSIQQPVAFNHKLHVEGNGLACVDCHVYVTSQAFAGLPTIEKCLECHSEAITKSPEEEKIRQAAAKGKQLVWNRLYSVPNHVYYSHRRHVVAGKLECAGCHGPIGTTTKPPAHALNELTMDFCMDCHRRRGVSVECIACHE